MDGMQMYTVLSQEKTTSPYFQGVHSRDTLSPLQENMCAIVNSDDSSQPGTHWKKKTQLSTSAENSTADPENIFLPPKENESAFQKAYKTFNLPNNDSSLGIKEFLLLRKEETIFIFCNELETYKDLKVCKWVHCIYSKVTDAGKMIKNVEFKTPNNEVSQETNLARLYDDMSEKIVKESEDFEGRDWG
ncbi:hypothetical protein TNCV_1451361 [Trichonephila clavipes]|nr:hypothetical protein TNCV_1451361 [Trichonephila clavipes]